MVWIPGGALVAGTPSDSLPRIADQELTGEQVILKGFYMDVFAYPNEEGAIQLTNVTEAEARAACAGVGKRLCTELEWERACKGPDNHIYEYGDRYRPAVCNTGTVPLLRPSGLRVGCRSDFGLYDLHGGAWEWTSSRWARGTSAELMTLRGGNAVDGELVGRCANAMGRPPSSKSDEVGFRCCAGPKNGVEVRLRVSHGPKLALEDRADRQLAKELVSQLDPATARELKDPASFTADRMWIWRPIGNEELVALSGCSGIARDPRCGILLARVLYGQPKLLTWASSGSRLPLLHAHRSLRDIWLLSSDEMGLFTRRIGYAWGRITVGEKERRVPRSVPQRRDKRRP
jgi:hypothetical protein